MNAISSSKPVLLMGATGRVSQLLLRHWDASPMLRPVYSQSRKEGFDLKWSPLEDGSKPLVAFSNEVGGLGAIIAMIGATPSTSGHMADTAALACAVVSAASEAKVSRVLLASSSAVYGIGEARNEANLCVPTGLYGKAKLEMEKAVAGMNANIEVCCLRIGNVAGADALLSNAGSRNASNTIQLDQFPDGKGPSRSYISPSHFARVIEQLIEREHPLPSCLNCAATPAVEMEQLLQVANLDWSWKTAPSDISNTQKITLDCSTLSKVLGEENTAATPASIIDDLQKLGAFE